MNELDYNNAEGIRRSDLWKMEDSPEKFRYFLDHPAEQTPAMAFGSACHKYILEPEGFDSEYVIAPRFDRRTSDGKAAYEAFMAENGTKTFVSEADLAVMMEMANAIDRCPLAQKLIRGKGETESAFFWVDRNTGERCKIKTDRLVKFRRRWCIVDYKTAQYADTFRFNSEMWKLGYYYQAGMYTEGVQIAKGLRRRPDFVFVVQEKKPPYSVNVIDATEEVIRAGNIKFHELLRKYHTYKIIDQWPGYISGNVPNDSFVPTWAEREMEDEL